MTEHCGYLRGCLLYLPGSGYVCWNSFWREWYLGPRRLSELFPWGMSSARAKAAWEHFPTARVRYENYAD